MFYYYPDSEPDSERLFLIQYVNKFNDSDFGKIEASVVRRAVADHPDPNNPDRTIYLDGKTAYGYRNASWSSSKKNALMVDDLIVSCQFDLKKDEAPYGADIRYMPYVVDAQNAERMVSTFKKVQKKMDEYYRDFGHPEGYSDFLRRVAKAMGITRFLVFTGNSRGLESPDIKEFDATSVDYNVRKLVDKARAGTLR